MPIDLEKYGRYQVISAQVAVRKQCLNDQNRLQDKYKSLSQWNLYMCKVISSDTSVVGTKAVIQWSGNSPGVVEWWQRKISCHKNHMSRICRVNKMSHIENKWTYIQTHIRGMELTDKFAEKALIFLPNGKRTRFKYTKRITFDSD